MARVRYTKLIDRYNSTCFYNLGCKGFIFVLKMISSVVVQYNLFKHKQNIFFCLPMGQFWQAGSNPPFVYGDIISVTSEGVFLNLYINIFLWNISMKQGPLTIDRASVLARHQQLTPDGTRVYLPITRSLSFIDIISRENEGVGK